MDMCMVKDGAKPERGSFEETFEDLDWEKRVEASSEEMVSLKKNGTWSLVDKDKKQNLLVANECLERRKV